MNKLRRGISLIEVLVVIGIIAILMAMVVPAVQSSRRAARTVQCKDNLRQVAIATGNYEGANKHWPYRLAELLPYLDHAVGYEIIREWETTPSDVLRSGSVPAVPDVLSFNCPEDWKRRTPQQTQTNFFINDGTTTSTKFGRKSNGVIADGFDQPRSPSTVTDGLSTTAMYSERLVWSGVDLSPLSRPPAPTHRYTWPVDGEPRTPDELLAAYNAMTDWSWPPVGPAVRAMRGRSSISPIASYDHVLPPNSRPIYGNTSRGRSYSTRPATSAHFGGVHVGFCDGHVRFVANDIDIKIWRAIGTRAGREVAKLD